ncbi:hypothetical protein [Actinoallomurus acanthiterrae]
MAADALEDRRRKNRIVHQELREAERLWCDGRSAGAEPSLNAAEELVALWAAYVLQMLGEQLLDADHAAHPQAPGFVSMTTAEQVLLLFDEVDSWMSRSGGPATELSGRSGPVCFAAPFPRWVRIEPHPRAHLLAMVTAGKEISERAVSLLTEGVRAARLRTQHVEALRSTLAESSATIYFAEKMLAEGPGRGDRAATAHHLQHSIETLYGFGWLATGARLIDHAE